MSPSAPPTMPPVSLPFAQRIADAQSLAEAAGALAEEARGLLDADAAVIIAGAGGAAGITLEAQDGLTGVPPTGSVLGSQDASTAGRALLARAGLRWVLVAPLAYPRRDLAVLAVGRGIPATADEPSWDGGLLAELAAFASPLLHNVDRAEQAGHPGSPGAQAERLRALGELASGVAHDLNNLLHAIALRARLLTQKIADPAAAADVAALERLTLNGSAAVKRLLDFARQRAPGAREALEPSAVVADVLMLVEPKWRRLAELAGLRFDVRSEIETARRPLGDAGELREALLNLAMNAVDAMPAGGSLVVRACSGAPGEVALEVEDNGVGMPADVLARVGQPFFTTKADRGGTGLGLAVVREIAHRSGGRLEIESEAGRGTRMRLVLPAAPARTEGLRSRALPTPPATPSAVSAAWAAAPGGGHPRLAILLVEDDPDVRVTLGEWFDLHGHAVRAAPDGTEAFEAFGQGTFDVAVLDLGLPGMSGWEVAAGLLRRQPGLPIVLVTGWGVTLDPDRLHDAGVAEVLTKPVSPDRLLAVCLRIARGREELRSGEHATFAP